VVALGPDIERNWGRRLSVSQDYLRDYPVQLGQLRLGPDLGQLWHAANQREPHFAAPLRTLRTMPVRIMPPYRFLFEKPLLQPL
jgi:cytochrome c oxidase cbb3-type subunit 2